MRVARHLTLLVEPELSVLLFKRDGWSEADMWSWSEDNRIAGRVLCIPSKWRGEPVFRLCMVNPDTSGERVLEILETMR